MRRLRLWPCKDIDLSWSDVVYAIWMCLVSPIARRGSRNFGVYTDAMVLPCMSVRAAFDLYLTARNWGPGDECIFVGVNVPAMFQIAESYGMSIRGSDIDPITTRPNLTQLRASINPRTRFIVVPHLFGHRLDLSEVIELAETHGVDLIEDCAQAFAGTSWWGTQGITLSLFSFGPMKTGTALQGAIAIVRDVDLLCEMKRKLRSYPIQPTWRYFLRVIRFGILKIASQRVIYGLLVRVMQSLRIDHEALVHASTKSVAAPEYQRWLSVRPCGALVRVINRKICTSDSSIELRISKGSALVDAIGQEVPLVLCGQRPNVFWMIPILVKDVDRCKCLLRSEGFDAMSGRLGTVVGARTSGAIALANAVMLPFSPRMSDIELKRLQVLITKLFASKT